MNIPVINFPAGAGGRWLGHMLGTIEQNLDQLQVLNKVNFHKGLNTKYYNIGHFEDDTPVDYVFSGRCKFNIFLNSWIKFRSANNYENFNALEPAQQVYQLSNEAQWRMGNVYHRIYEQKIDLDYGAIFLDTEKFRDQLLCVLQLHWPQQFVSRLTQDYIDFATLTFRATAIDPADHLGNVESIGWLAWCHAQYLLKNVSIPVSVTSQFAEYQDWVKHNQNWIIEKTQALIL
jgi:hypothetical protein